MMDMAERIRADLDRAKLDFEAGLYEQAFAAVRRVLTLDPGHAEARLIEARINLQAHRPKAALSALDVHRWYEQSKPIETPEATWMQAQALMQVEQFGLAAVVLERLCATYVDDARIHRAMAVASERLNRGERAMQAYRQVLRIEPGDDASRRAMARLLAPTEPEAAADLLLEGGPVDNNMLRQAARLYAKATRHAEAESIYRALIAGHRQDAGLLREAAEVADAAGDDYSALRRLREAISLRPGDAALWSSMAKVHMHAGRFEQAGRCWWKAARRDGSAQTWTGLAVCAMAVNRSMLSDRAIARASTQTRSTRRSPRIERQIAQHWTDAATGIAVRRALNGLRFSDDDQHPLTALLTDAVRTLEAHAARYPNRADTHYHLARCRRELRLTSEADAAVKQAIAINPRYEAALQFAESLQAEETKRRAA